MTKFARVFVGVLLAVSLCASCDRSKGSATQTTTSIPAHVDSTTTTPEVEFDDLAEMVDEATSTADADLLAFFVNHVHVPTLFPGAKILWAHVRGGTLSVAWRPDLVDIVNGRALNGVPLGEAVKTEDFQMSRRVLGVAAAVAQADPTVRMIDLISTGCNLASSFLSLQSINRDLIGSPPSAADAAASIERATEPHDPRLAETQAVLDAGRDLLDSAFKIVGCVDPEKS